MHSNRKYRKQDIDEAVDTINDINVYLSEHRHSSALANQLKTVVNHLRRIVNKYDPNDVTLSFTMDTKTYRLARAVCLMKGESLAAYTEKFLHQIATNATLRKQVAKEVDGVTSKANRLISGKQTLRELLVRYHLEIAPVSTAEYEIHYHRLADVNHFKSQQRTLLNNLKKSSVKVIFTQDK